MPEWISGRLRKSAAAADPRTIPALTKEIGQDRRGNDGHHRSPEQQKNPQARALCQRTERTRPQIIVLERPEVTEIKLGLIQKHHQVRDQKGQSQLKKHD